MNPIRINSTDWKEYSVVFSPSEDQVTSNRANFYKEATPGTGQIDNVTFEEIDITKLSGEIQLTSSVYEVDNAQRLIKKVPSGVEVVEFVSNLTTASGGYISILKGNRYARPSHDPFGTGITIKVYAENGAFEFYKIARDNAVIKSSTVGMIDDANSTLTQVEGILNLSQVRNGIDLNVETSLVFLGKDGGDTIRDETLDN